MGYIKGEDRNQGLLLPEYIDDYVTEDNHVRIIDAFVDSLNLDKLNFKHARPKATGRPPYDPKDLLKLYMYGYFNRIRSSRKLEAECKRNLELMWLISRLTPDHKTIADFRKDNKKPLVSVFRHFTQLCNELGLYGKEIVAIDGSKIRANNSKRNNFSKKKVARQLKYIDEKIQEFMDEIERNDGSEESNPKMSTEELQKRISEFQQRREHYVALEERVEEEGEVSLTDPDSRMMKCGNNNGTEVSHNVQISVDSKHSLIVDFDVTSNPTDLGCLYKMARRSKYVLGARNIKVLADKGYYKTKCLFRCSNNELETYVAKPKSASPTGDTKYTKENFVYDPDKDIYTCPAGKELRYRRTRVSGDIAYGEYINKKECQQCEHRSQCTKSNFRSISRNEHQKVLDEVDKRTKDKKSLYRMRQMIVEHPFGTIKRGFGYSYFLLNGKQGVRAESALHFLIYNLKRVINIMGFGRLMAELVSRSSLLFREYLFIFEIVT